MLNNHLDHRTYGKANNLESESWCQTKGVATTNVDLVGNFGKLDRLEKLKSKGLDLDYENNIIYLRNKTSHWKQKLTTGKLEKTLDFAKKYLKAERRLCFSKRKK